MVERKLTLAVIIAIAAQAAGALLWTGAASARLVEVETRVDAQDHLSERLARVEVQLQLLATQAARIEQKLDAQ